MNTTIIFSTVCSSIVTWKVELTYNEMRAILFEQTFNMACKIELVYCYVRYADRSWWDYQPFKFWAKKSRFLLMGKIWLAVTKTTFYDSFCQGSLMYPSGIFFYEAKYALNIPIHYLN